MQSGTSRTNGKRRLAALAAIVIAVELAVLIMLIVRHLP